MHVLAATVIALSSLTAPPNFIGMGDPPPTEKVTIDLVTVNGNGCGHPRAASVAPDNSAFILDYGEVVAEVGGLARPTDARKNCQFHLRINVPNGYTYALAPTTYRGWVHLEPGATARARFTHHFQGTPNPHDKAYPFTGPVDDYWERVDPDGPGLPCGEKRNVTFGAELRASLGTSDPKKPSYIAVDSFSTVHHFTWTRCP